MISGFKDAYEQPLLWDEELDLGDRKRHGRVRTVVGALAERLTARLVGGRVHKTDCTSSYCPDVSAGGVYFESKAVGRSGQVFVYAGRLDKDREFARRHRLVYVVWNHGADSKLADTVAGVERLVLTTMQAVYVVPFCAVDAACAAVEPSKLNSRYGGSDSRPEYGSGYRVPLSRFDRWVHRRYEGGYAEG